MRGCHAVTPPRPTVVLLHALGASGRSFDEVVDAWNGAFDVLAPDLPGFGERAADTAFDLEAAVQAVVATVRTGGASRWLLVGHSMGGKIASLVAARTLGGTLPLFGLAGVVLLAGSPPVPEPMSEERREQMLGWIANGPLADDAEQTFVAANSGAPLPAAAEDRLVDDLRRMSLPAWEAWLRRGSREDVSAEVGTLDLPALVLGGDADADLGAAAQPDLHGTVYPRARFVSLPGAGHLLPQERPREVAAAIEGFWSDVASLGPGVPPEQAALIASDRVTARVRGALAQRAVADDPSYAPRVLTPDQLMTLRAVADRVVPQGDDAIDLAARVDARLAAGAGDGWRHATLPDDVTAYRLALAALVGFDGLTPEAQDDLVQALAAGRHSPPGSALSAAQLALWFEDARDDLTKQWVTHPATAAAIGFDGFADGGDRTGRIGFVRLGAGDTDLWEPRTVVGGNPDADGGNR